MVFADHHPQMAICELNESASCIQMSGPTTTGEVPFDEDKCREDDQINCARLQFVSVTTSTLFYELAPRARMADLIRPGRRRSMRFRVQFVSISAI